MINIKNYSKIRILLAIPLVIFAFVIFTKIYSEYSQKNYFVIIPYFIGTILFVLNRKLADYISFAIFTFGFSGFFAFWLNKNSFITKPEDLFFFFLAIFVSIFLLTNIFKVKK